MTIPSLIFHGTGCVCERCMYMCEIYLCVFLSWPFSCICICVRYIGRTIFLTHIHFFLSWCCSVLQCDTYTFLSFLVLQCVAVWHIYISFFLGQRYISNIYTHIHFFFSWPTMYLTHIRPPFIDMHSHVQDMTYVYVCARSNMTAAIGAVAVCCSSVAVCCSSVAVCCSMTHTVYVFVYVLIHTATYVYVRRRLLLCLTWLIHACGFEHSRLWHDSFVWTRFYTNAMCVTWLVCMRRCLQKTQVLQPLLPHLLPLCGIL